MWQLTKLALERAREFVFSQARPLEQTLYRYHFEAGTAESVLTELAAFQNPDGGFGRALEPDMRAAASSAVTTAVGLQWLREVRADETHPVVQSAIRYLLKTFDAAKQRWEIVTSAVATAPHAPWWTHNDELQQNFGHFLANPRAEIVGYLYDYPGLSDQSWREGLLNEIVTHLTTLPDKIDMHDLLCYVNLVETPDLPNMARQAMLPKLQQAVDLVVAKDPAEWEGYGAKPLSLVSSPHSPFASQLAQEISLNLDYTITHQGEDGAWRPNWSWDFISAEAWAAAERDWKGVLTIKTLKQLRDFGRWA